jgi:hypothetical protein
MLYHRKYGLLARFLQERSYTYRLPTQNRRILLVKETPMVFNMLFPPVSALMMLLVSSTAFAETPIPAFEFTNATEFVSSQ